MMSMVPFPESTHGERYCQAAIDLLRTSGRTTEEIDIFREKITDAFGDSPSISIDATETDAVFKFLRKVLDQLLQAEAAELESNKLLKSAQEAELRAQEAELRAQEAELRAQEAELETKKRTGEAFVCLDHLVFDRDIHLHPPGALPCDHCGELFWNSLPTAGSTRVPTPTNSKKLRQVESKIYHEHKAKGFPVDVSGRSKDCCPGAQFGHIGPLAPSCRNHWIDALIYSAGQRFGRSMTREEAEMLMYGSQSPTGVKDFNSLFTDGTNFVFSDHDGCCEQDPSHILAPIMKFKDQLETDGRSVSALVLARDITSLALPGFLYGKYETLDPRNELDKREIDLAFDALEDGVNRLISLYCPVFCASFLWKKKYCPELRKAIADEGKFRGFRYDQSVAGDRLFMKITFSDALKRGQPYPVAADGHSCPNLAFLALRNAKTYCNYLYKKGLIPRLPYDASIPAAVIVPVCMDVEGGTRGCGVCRRFVAEHVHGEAYYTSESGDDEDSDSSDSDGKDKLALSGSSDASLRDTAYMDGGSAVECDGC